MSSLLTSLPPWALFLLVLISGLLSAKAGAWLMRMKDRREAKDKPATSVGSLLGALLGLLAFMLGFTFSIAATRLSERKHLVVEQANAIGTAYLRTGFLPDKQKQQTQAHFKEYSDLLVTAPNSISIGKSISRLEALQIQIWEQAISLKDENMDPQLRALYISSVNEMLDIFGERKTVALVFKIPGAIWTVLLVIFIFSMFVAGLELNSVILRKNLHVPIMTAAFALIVALISFMDSSTKAGHYSVSQQPLIDVQQMIKEELSQTAQ